MKYAETRSREYKRGYDTAIAEHGDKNFDELNKAFYSASFGLRGFYYTRRDGTKDYKVIVTSYDNGYFAALDCLMTAALIKENEKC